MEVLDEDDGDENQLQTSYLLHRGSTKGSGKVSTLTKKRANGTQGPMVDDCEHLPKVSLSQEQRRLWAFNTVWDRISKVVEDTMEEQHQELHEEMQQWICNTQYRDAQLDLCQSERAGLLGKKGADREFQRMPRTKKSLSKQLHTALLFLGGIDPSDHQKTFDGLTGHLQAHKCHVARLTSLHFPLQAGVGGVLRVLFRQLIDCTVETTDMDILLAWHSKPKNNGKLVAIVVENVESCESKILGELILLLSDWIEQIPMVLVMSVATTGDVLSNLLPADAIVRLQFWRFSLKSPPEILEAVMRAVMIDSFCAFEFSYGVVAFLYGFFEGQDHTVTAIFRALKIAAMEHFWKEPLSFLCGNVLKVNSKSELEEACLSLSQELLNHAAALPSVAELSSESGTELPFSKQMAEALWQLRGQKKKWAMAFFCLQSVGKQAGIKFSELLCEALSGSFMLPSAEQGSVAKRCKGKEASDTDRKCLTVDKLSSKLRDMPDSALKSVLEEWRNVTVHEEDLNKDICQLLLNLEAGVQDKDLPESDAAQASCKQDYTVNTMNRSKLRKMGKQQLLMSQKTQVKTPRSMAQALLHRILTEFLVPPESLPFNEIFCFKKVNFLKEALIGQTRKRVHLDLLNPHDLLKCKCCASEGVLSPSLHDTALAYGLSQDHGDLIEVHTWYQSFLDICKPKNIKVSEDDQKRGRGRPKKRKLPTEVDPLPLENTVIEARFTQAATELQIVGLLFLPKKGQSDCLRRVRL